MRISPSTTHVVIVSFEGPDRYSTAGGLATRVTDLAPALARRGYHVTHVFMGDPQARPEETREGGRLRLVRWGQWISRYHPRGVYDGEWGKWRDLSDNAPGYLVDLVARGRRGRAQAVLLFEDWQTAECATRTAELAYARGLWETAATLWNANNTYGCGGIDFARLRLTSTVCTVSRWMRTELEPFGADDAVVVPNGLAERMLAPVPPADVRALRGAKGESLLFVKVARFDADKRWMGAVDAVASLRHEGIPVRFLFRGSQSPYREEVLAHVVARGLRLRHLTLGEKATAREMARALRQIDAHAISVDSFVPEPPLRALYAAADGVLANSEREPFGLVGLEVMGAGGIAYVGVTGEDYAQPLGNCVVVRTADPLEIARSALVLRERPELAKRIRAEGRQTAKRYAWPRVIEDMEVVWEQAAARRTPGL